MAKNFPSFYPIIFHDIQLEVPQPFRGICRNYYYGWMILVCGGSLLDIIASIIFFSSFSLGHPDNHGLSRLAVNYIGLRVLNFLLLSIMYFWLLYWPLYKGLTKNSSPGWIIFWIASVVHLGWLVFLFIAGLHYLIQCLIIF